MTQDAQPPAGHFILTPLSVTVPAGVCADVAIVVGESSSFDASFTTTLTLTATATGVGSDCGPLSTQTCVAITDVVAMVDLDFGSVADNNETNDGGFLCVNDDDDDNNGTPDKDDASPTLGEDDLMPLTITADGAQQGTLTLSAVTGGSSRIKVYENADRSNPVTLPASWNLLGLPKSFTTVLYVEGIGPSAMARDTELLLKAILQNGDSCEDRVKLTVYKVDLKEVSFFGVGGHNLHRDTDGMLYSEPHWQDNSSPLDGDADDEDDNDRKSPKAYVRGSVMRAVTRLIVSPTDLFGSGTRIRGDGPGGIDF